MSACRFCGCTEERACPGGCSWVLPDVCSSEACLEGLTDSLIELPMVVEGWATFGPDGLSHIYPSKLAADLFSIGMRGSVIRRVRVLIAEGPS